MANNFEQIMALVNAGNKMGLSNTITRDNGIPLDLSSVYNSYEDAVVYAATRAIAYHGQPIAVITETDADLYVITPTSQGKLLIEETEYDIFIKQVGTKTLVDDESIYSKSEVDAALEQILQSAKDHAEEQDSSIQTALNDRIDSVVELIGDTDSGIIKKVEDNASAISAEAVRATDAEADLKDYIDTEISGLSVTIEQKDGNDCIVIKNKAGVEVAYVSASKFVQDSFLDDVDYNAETGKIIFTWTMSDGSTKTDDIDVSDFVDTYTAGNGLTLNNNEFAIDTNVVALAADLEAIRDTAQTADQVSAAIEAKIQAENLEQYAKSTDVEATLAEYIKSTDAASTYTTKAEFEAEIAKQITGGSIAHTSEGVSEGVVVNGNSIAIVIDSYTKQETRDYVEDVVVDMIGSGDASAVRLALENHISTYEAKVAEIEDKASSQDALIQNFSTDLDAAELAIANIVTDNAARDAAIEALNDKVADMLNLKASSEITITEDGTLGLGEVNVNKLVQTDGDMLVLSGGSAI